MNKKSLWYAGIAMAVVGAASVGAIGIASASDDTPVRTAAASAPTTDNNNDHNWGPWHGGGWGGHWGGGPWGGDLSQIVGADVTDLLHGEVVLARQGGGTQTVLVQKGSVTDVSGTAVTVKSADGVTTSYTVNGDTKVHADTDKIDSVAKNEEVVVVAPKSGDARNATMIVDLTDLGWK